MKMKKALTAGGRDRLRREILSAIEECGGLYRRELNTRLSARYGLTRSEGRDNTPNSRKNLLFSAIGTLLSDLCREGALLRSEDGRYTPQKSAHVAVQEAACREELLAFLKEAHTRAELDCHLSSHFSTDKTETPEDDRALLSLTDTLLASLTAEGEVTKEGDTLRRTEKTDEFFPEGEEEALRRRYLALIHRQGGPFLERFAVTLLTEYYRRTGRTVLLAEVSGGAQDGGIDGRLHTVDGLGFREEVLLQTKCRREDLHVTETEVRGFFGAMCAADGSRGIFVTTSYFHESARRFLDALPNCIGMDGKLLFKIALQCSFGLHKKRGGYTIDRRTFSESL